MHWFLPFFTHYLLDSTHTLKMCTYFIILSEPFCVYIYVFLTEHEFSVLLCHNKASSVWLPDWFSLVFSLFVLNLYCFLYIWLYGMSHCMEFLKCNIFHFSGRHPYIYCLGLIWAGKLCGSYKLCVLCIICDYNCSLYTINSHCRPIKVLYGSKRLKTGHTGS